jgi:nicotinamidase-related amidase
MGALKAPPGPDSIHLCLDMQRLFAPGGPWPTPWLPRVLPVVADIVAHAPERTVFTRFVPPASPGEAHGMWQAYYRKWPNVTRAALDPALLRLVAELERFVPPASVIDKPVYSAFATGRLSAFLREKAIDTLIVTGSETDVCVLSTVLAAVDLGYRTILVKDGLCSSSDDTHDALLGLYARRFDVQIELAEAREVIAGWRV